MLGIICSSTINLIMVFSYHAAVVVLEASAVKVEHRSLGHGELEVRLTQPSPVGTEPIVRRRSVLDTSLTVV
jgi:hypothetical protein